MCASQIGFSMEHLKINSKVYFQFSWRNFVIRSLKLLLFFFLLENATPNRFDLNIILYIRSFSIDIFNLKWVCGLLSITYIMWLSDSNRFSHFRWRSSFRLIAIVLNGGKKNWILDCKLHPSMHVTTQYIM